MENLIFNSNEKVLFIGDSITDCGRRQDEEKLGHGYVRKITELLTAKYPTHNIDYINNVVHSTFKKNYKLIKNDGLCRMSRNHIHFAKTKREG